MKPEGTIWITGTYHSIYQCGFALQVAKFQILNDTLWFKPNASPNLKGDLIIDPFTGSLTTGIIAYRLERNFIGIDTEKNTLIYQYKDLKN